MEDYKDRGRVKKTDFYKYAYDRITNDKDLTPKQKMWFFNILYILKDGGCVRVMADNCLIDIMGVAYTPSYAASFWDVYNNLDRFCTNVDPVRISKIENDFHNLAKNE